MHSQGCFPLAKKDTISSLPFAPRTPSLEYRRTIISILVTTSPSKGVLTFALLCVSMKQSDPASMNGLFVFLSLNLETTFSKLRVGPADVEAVAKPALSSDEPLERAKKYQLDIFFTTTSAHHYHSPLSMTRGVPAFAPLLSSLLPDWKVRFIRSPTAMIWCDGGNSFIFSVVNECATGAILDAKRLAFSPS